jgi:hypothetical protein
VVVGAEQLLALHQKLGGGGVIVEADLSVETLGVPIGLKDPQEILKLGLAAILPGLMEPLEGFVDRTAGHQARAAVSGYVQGPVVIENSPNLSDIERHDDSLRNRGRERVRRY